MRLLCTSLALLCLPSYAQACIQMGYDVASVVEYLTCRDADSADQIEALEDRVRELEATVSRLGKMTAVFANAMSEQMLSHTSRLDDLEAR